MQLAQKVTQDLLDSYIGGEMVVQNDRSLTRGTVTSLRIKGDLIQASIKNISWKFGSLDDVHAGEPWSEESPQGTNVLLSTDIKSLDDGVIVLGPSLRDTSARLSRRASK